MLSNWVTRIEGLDKSILRKYFTVDSPLGPLDASRVVDGSVIELLTDRELLLLHGQHTSPSIVIGRRGSGKTSYLRRLQIENPTSPFIELRTSRTFNALVSAMTEAASDGVTAELLADVWDAIFWIVLAWKVHSSGRPRIGLIKVREHVKALGLDQCHSFDAVTDRLGRIFALARQADGDFAIDFVLSMLSKGASLEDVKSLLCRDIQEQGLHAFIVMDSLDDYPLDVVKFRKALAGLLKCAGRFNSVETPYQVRLCLPAELYWEFVDEISSNSARQCRHEISKIV